MKYFALLLFLAGFASAEFQVTGAESSFEGLGMQGDWTASSQSTDNSLDLKYSLPEADGDVFVTLRFDTTGENEVVLGFNEYSKKFLQKELFLGQVKAFVPREFVKQSNSIRVTATAKSAGSSFTLHESSTIGVYEAPVIMASKRIDDYSLREGDVATVTVNLKNTGLLGYTVIVEDGTDGFSEFIQVIEGGGPRPFTLKSGEEKTYTYAFKARKSIALALPNPVISWETQPSHGAIVLEDKFEHIVIAPAKPFLGVSASPSKNLLEAGGKATYTITLKNSGELEVESLTAEVKGDGVSVYPSRASLEGLGKGESADLVFDVQASGAGSAGIECMLKYSTAGEEYEQSCPGTQLVVQERSFFNEYVIAGFALLALFIIGLLAVRFRIREVEGARRKHLPEQELADRVFDEKRPWKKR